MSTGFSVRVPGLRGYGGNLDEFASQADTFAELVNKADVSDESWGLVGLATKGSYSDALAELNDLLSRMKDGLTTAADKIRKAAELYEANDRDSALLLGRCIEEIDTVAEAGPAGI